MPGLQFCRMGDGDNSAGGVNEKRRRYPRYTKGVLGRSERGIQGQPGFDWPFLQELSQVIWIVVRNGNEDDRFSVELLRQIIEMGNGPYAWPAGGIPEFQHHGLAFQFVPSHFLQVRALHHLAELERRRDIADFWSRFRYDLRKRICTAQQKP